jgi:aminoglycoside phosphotransferase family enzyme/predicted kinase
MVSADPSAGPPKDQGEIIAFLSRPQTYGPGIATVERIDTHISALFLAGPRVYKLKRAVKFPYLDFTELEARRRYCEVEVKINRRTAPEIYEGVLAVTRDAKGRLALAGKGEAVDYVVVMRRFDQGGLFDRLAERGALTPELMTELADEIARFHSAAERMQDFGGRSGIAAVLTQNREAFARHGPQVFDPDATARLVEASDAALARVGRLLERRRQAGYVRHCHGDLHLRNICLFEGRPTLFDAIEFSDAIACVDVLYDLAFLLMDLEHRNERGLANLVLNRYLTQAEARLPDFEGLAALPLFLSCRAAVRAHVAADAAKTQADETRREAELAAARSYHALAGRLIAPPPPVLVAVGGLSGTGKSTLARRIAPLLGAVPGALVCRSDVIRKHLFGKGELARLPPEAYRSEVSARVYRTIAERARTALSAGHAAIADAVYARADERQGLESLAREAGVPFIGFWLEAPPEVLESRLMERRRDASDATVEVLRQQLTYPLGEITWRRIDTSRGPEATLAAVRAELGL